MKFIIIAGKLDKKESIVRTYDRSTIKKKLEQIDVNKLLLNIWSDYSSTITHRSFVYALLQLPREEGRVDLVAHYHSLLSDLPQVDVVGYRNVEGRTLEDFVLCHGRLGDVQACLDLLHTFWLLFANC